MKSEYMVTSVSVETETQEEIINPAKQFRGFKGVWIPREIWLNTDLSVLEKVVIAEVDSLDGNRGCFASNKYMSIFLGISESRAAHLMADLIKREYIESYGFNGRFRKLRLGKTAMLKKAELDSQKQHIGHAENSIHITKQIEKDTTKKELESGSKDPSSPLPLQEERKSQEGKEKSNKAILLAKPRETTDGTKLFNAFCDAFEALNGIRPQRSGKTSTEAARIVSGYGLNDCIRAIKPFFEDVYAIERGFPWGLFSQGIASYISKANIFGDGPVRKLSQNEIEYHRAMKRLEEKHERERRERIG